VYSRHLVEISARWTLAILSHATLRNPPETRPVEAGEELAVQRQSLLHDAVRPLPQYPVLCPYRGRELRREEQTESVDSCEDLARAADEGR